MQVRVITVEREYGSGGAAIAEHVAQRLGWKLWDRDLTAEIARTANVDHVTAARCDERVDSLLYRLFKVYARGSYERALPVGESRMFDTDRMFATLEKVIEEVAGRGNCVIVGRGAPYILRNRPDAFHVFVYAPIDEKIRRLKSIGKSEKEAAQLIGEIDRERAAFIRHYFNKEWPLRTLYNLMINSKFGDEYVTEMILQQVAALEKRPAVSSAETKAIG
ncbi:MAG TPA: cytidylate kinase-like family protein [Candidatus Acidoferrales bacterium]|jgi:cytidylate kinase|nr:cytidylate kinase-like family protein [Candidatus Acidoferrales bacterium]